MNPKITKIINGVEVRRLMSDEDVEEYRRLLKQLPDEAVLVELGSFDGGSLISLADTIKEKNLVVIVVDLFNQAMTDDFNDRGQMLGSKQSCYDNLKQAGIKVLEMLKDTDDLVRWFRQQDGKANMIFVDADHSYEAVKKDINALWPFVLEGGFLSGHDFFPNEHPGCVKAVLEKFGNVCCPEKTGVWSIQKPKLKFAVVSLNDAHYKPLQDITWEGKLDYCSKWGYTPIHFLQPERTRESLDTEGHNQWYGFAKIKRILEVLETEKFDWVFFTECDALITNHTIPLSAIVDENFHLLLTSNFDGINMGNLMVRNTREAKDYLTYIYSLYPKYKNAGYAEQQAVMDTWQQYRDIIRVMPQRAFNSHDHFLYEHYKVPKEKRKDIGGQSGEWEVGDFQIHWCGFGLEKRLEFAEYYKDRILL